MPFSPKHRSSDLNTSAMADIAFLLLVFFMVTTVIKDEKGISISLPALEVPSAPVNDRNLFSIQINSHDQFFVEKTRRESLEGLRLEIKKFIFNNGENQDLSENPEKAVISLKADRGTSHQVFVSALDEIQAAYYEIYAERAGITPDQFRKLDLNKTEDRLLHEKGKKGIPMNISIAEPTRAGH